jgi:hypothetical protein
VRVGGRRGGQHLRADRSLRALLRRAAGEVGALDDLEAALELLPVVDQALVGLRRAAGGERAAQRQQCASRRMHGARLARAGRGRQAVRRRVAAVFVDNLGAGGRMLAAGGLGMSTEGVGCSTC